ncbi:MAG TPA: Gfo/Idh/MocA family oxidoreductase [Clostridiales bacterium]|nr:Gfo/Idh/MocA family oxidoreductase [Clostridiales bacterium]HPP35816.1 Gfo/Idh/MocA family oxidoreductase [Clostridiales bacterium]
MIGIGIIGCGSIAIARHVPEYHARNDCVIIGYYDPKPERAVKLAGQYGGKVFDSLEELLADREIDAVSVCTSNKYHAPVTIAALKAGKHVLCEKPIATSVNEAQEMVDTARKTGKFLMIGHNQRLAPAHVRAKEILKTGELGRILTFRTTFGHGGPESWSQDKGRHTWFFKKDDAFIGAMGDLGVHKADLIRWLIDDEIVEVKAYVATLDKKNEDNEPIEVDDNALCLLKSKSGIYGTLTASWTYYGSEDNSTVLYCTNGVMKIYDDPEFPIEITKKNREKVFYKVGNIQTNENQTASGVIDMFIDSVNRGEEPEISGEEGLAALRIVMACLESAATGKTITL